MIIPSIDIMGGRAVQLIGGEALEIDAGDPRPIMERFSRVGEVAVIDLDAARGVGENSALIAELCAMGPCRVGGGIRGLDNAIRWLDAGAAKIILGTAAEPDLLGQLPRERVIAALDARDGQVMDRGWRNATGRDVRSCMGELRGLVGGFLVTLIEREGRMGGADLGLASELAELAQDARLTIAGGVTTGEEIAALDAMGCDAQVGMALYSGRLDLGEAVFAVGKSDRADGLVPTVIVDERGEALGQAYSSGESLRTAIQTGRGVYRSRARGLWVKGETSGDTQRLLRIDWDCDRDCLRFTVRQAGRGNCHLGTRSCWGPGGGLGELARRIDARYGEAPPGSYTRRLFENAALLDAKLREEVGELIEASSEQSVAHEAADVLYFLLVKLRREGVALETVERVLDQRAMKVTRRKGDAKIAIREEAR